MIKVAINGFGRIGRCALKLLIHEENIEVVAVNDPTNAEQLAYLFKYDSVHRKKEDKVSYTQNSLIVNGKNIKVFNTREIPELPWGELNVDVVLECTGKFLTIEECNEHLKSGAKHVILSAPSKDNMKTIVYGVNEENITNEDKFISCASCTTNCLVPVINLLHKNYKIRKGFISTVHAITNDQSILDGSHKKGIESRRGRSAGYNIIPTTTGAASQIGKVIPELNGLLDGISFRVPVADGSLINVNVEVEKNVTIEEINNLFKSNQNEVLKYTSSPIVSSDIIGETCGSLVDGLSTNTIKDDRSTIISMVSWYDNEMGYTAQMIRTLKKLMGIH